MVLLSSQISPFAQNIQKKCFEPEAAKMNFPARAQDATANRLDFNKNSIPQPFSIKIGFNSHLIY